MQDCPAAVLPVGALEQHGHHLPLGTDTIIASAIAQRLVHQFPSFYLLPVLPFSQSFEHVKFPGAVSLRTSTLLSVLGDIVSSLEHSGIQKLIIVNGHGGNHFLWNFVQEQNADCSKVFVAPSRKDWDFAYKQANLSVNLSDDMHAGEGETSILLFLGENVRKEEAVDVPSTPRTLLQVKGMRAYTKTGNIGYPTRASEEKGKILLDSLVEHITPSVKEFVYE
ncbi:creatininase family protein [Thermoactinomyces sp. AMNI-1]|uniref:Creatininase family protein n=1 Tax=Thermoactinomyces mirandus TaxID=2756294 RepID=A0A7W1XRW5_9BACL|nr:creatininase family protein [Thermoactinomyces mirandus]MBA4602187.1 creatininase family protein [Thermoactinomyces mirandus]